MLDPILTAERPFQHCRIAVARPLPSTVHQPTGAAERGLTEGVLMRTVVADHPIPPERRHGVDVERKTVPALRGSDAARWSGIESLPAVTGKVCFHPRVRIFGSDHIVSGKVVELVAAKSVDYARRNSQRAQHDCH